jgi:hypothetical protein
VFSNLGPSLGACVNFASDETIPSFGDDEAEALKKHVLELAPRPGLSHTWRSSSQTRRGDHALATIAPLRPRIKAKGRASSPLNCNTCLS